MVGNNHPIENLMRSTMENLKEMIDVNTVIGDSIQTNDGTCIVPISKVTFGFASGGTEFGDPCKIDLDKDAKHPFGGGSGAGVTVKPVAFLVVRNDSVRLINVEHANTADKVIDSIPQLIDTFKGLFSKDSCNNNSNCKDSLDESDSSSNNLF